MREDMAKVIVERPRYGSWYRTRNRNAWKQIPWDEQTLQIGNRKEKCAKGRKDLNENLNPLFRFLNSKVGHPWNDVYSEIRERINMNSAVQFHIWQHVERLVCQHAYINQGHGRWIAFYVDEATGILTRNMDYYRFGGLKRETRDFDFEDKDRWQFRLIEGQWKKVILKALPFKEWEELWDAYFKFHCGRIGLLKLEEAYGPQRYAVAVVPINQEEMEQIRKQTGRWWH